MNVYEADCPNCYTPGSLSIKVELAAKPVGDFSLAGAQIKVSAFEVPVLSCWACPLRVTGRFDEDRSHAVFPTAGQDVET